LDVTALQRDLPIIAPQVEKAAKEGSLVITDGRITSFVGGTAGLMIDVEAMRQSILTDWSITTSTLPLLVRVIPAKLAGEDPKRLGIHELIGVGRSNFSGSPTNRRKNIAHGVELVHATILQPGEEFSLLKTLGPIDEEHKWLPELVIKGNKTLPEFGGGLCQIGTTVFRGALDSGLPIVERQNHSYRVRYYEPAGTDATIYDPKPDFRFLNDTGAPILINGYIEKNDEVVFEFWGTKDGRVSERTDPRIYNVTAPPATKLIETLDLEPGKKKCTETAHAGADAEFTYTVTYANGEVKKEVFRSHYRPWQAVCLIGVEKLSTPSDTSAGEIPLDPAAATSSHP
jgi:vancomycin resistance protein YoaR